MTLLNLPSTSVSTVLLSMALVIVQLSAAGSGYSHSVDSAQVVARVTSDATKESLGVVSATTDPNLERLLIIRVSARWQDVDATARREVARQWHHLWQSAVANGVVAVVDDVSGDSLVGYDGEGNATLRRLPAGRNQPSAAEEPEDKTER